MGKTAERPAVTVVVPVYRSRDTVAPLFTCLRDVFEVERLAFEVLFVEDACPEGSIEVLTELAARDERVGVLNLTRNVGQHASVLIGLRYALGDRAIVIDADLQDPPAAIPQLLAALDKGADAVFAARRGRYESRMRRMTSRVFKMLQHVAAGVPVDAGMYLAMGRTLMDRLAAVPLDTPSVVAAVGLMRAQVASVPVTRARRAVGGSAYSSWRRVRVGLRILLWALRWRTRRPQVQGHGKGREPADVESLPIKEHIGARFSGSYEPLS